VGGSHAVPCIPKSCIDPIPHVLLGLGLRENAIRVPKHCLVQKRISVSKTSVPSIFHGVWLSWELKSRAIASYMSYAFHRVWGVSYSLFLIIFFTETAFDIVQYAPLFEL